MAPWLIKKNENMRRKLVAGTHHAHMFPDTLISSSVAGETHRVVCYNVTLI